VGILNPNLKPPAQKDLEDFLNSGLKGQPQAIAAVSKKFASFKSGVKEVDDQDSQKPIGIFLFLGLSRTGKTELGRLLAQYFHGTKKAATIIGCADYQEKHEVGKLIGAPPGYIGYDDKPRLSREKLLSVIPGYQPNSPSQPKSDKKEDKKEEDDDFLDKYDASTYLLNKFRLINKSLNNIDWEFSYLPNYQLKPEDQTRLKKDLKFQKRVLNLSSKKLRLRVIEAELEQLKNEHAAASSAKPTASPSKPGSRHIKVTEPAETARLTPATAAVKVKAKEDPILVIVFDEIEKAHDALRQWLLHLMEEGHTVLGNGEKIDLSRTFIILTSNIGSNLVGKAVKGIGQIGFAPQGQKVDLEKLIKAELKKYFKPEFLNRLDAIVTFNMLSAQDFRDILELKIRALALFLEKRLVQLEVGIPVKNFILEEAAKNLEGQAKSLQDCFKKYLAEPVGNLLVSGQLTDKKKLKVLWNTDKKQIIFEI